MNDAGLRRKISRVFSILLVASCTPLGVNASATIAHHAQDASGPAGAYEAPTVAKAAAPSLPSIDPSKLSFQLVATGLVAPVFVTNAGDGSGRLFILEKPGRIRVVKNGSLLTTPFLDITAKVRSTGSEQGLLGLAFHPSYSSNGYFYVAYTAPRPSDSVGSVLTLERYSVSGDPDVATSTSGSAVLTIDHPAESNHNGGMLAFGPDGFLYWSAGDGGGGGDPSNNAQTLSVLLGKILRLDVDHNDSGLNYAIPAGNPFVESPDDPSTRAEIWAYGLRNPWRFSFDRLTGDLYIGDVGQSLWEEVDFQPAGDLGGENYGWRLMEGFHCYNPPTDCDPGGLTPPITEYPHHPECAVTGGYVYRGSDFPALAGRYFYGDYCSGQLWSLYYDSGWIVEPLVDTPYSISSFGEDESGELYVVDLGGTVYRMVYDEVSPPTVADFDGNGTSDLAIYRPSNGVWYIKDQFNSGWGGQAGDVPVPGDYKGDGKADVAIYRPSTGVFYIKNVFNQGWGGQVGDVPVPGDYFGDGDTDVAIWRPSTGVFYVKYVFNSGWGAVGDIPVPGDYDGNGTTDVAVFRPSNNVWYIKGIGNFTWGNSGDVPVPGDYNGDGTTDIAVWRPSTGTWYVRGQPPYLVWGTSTDIPVPGDYNGDGKTDLAVYIPSSGTWSVKDQFDTVWGAVGDYPVEAPDTNGDGDPYQ